MCGEDRQDESQKKVDLKCENKKLGQKQKKRNILV